MLSTDQSVKQFRDFQEAFAIAAGDQGKYVRELQAQLAAGSPVTAVQLDALRSNTGHLNTMVQTFDICTLEKPAAVPPVAADAVANNLAKAPPPKDSPNPAAEAAAASHPAAEAAAASHPAAEAAAASHPAPVSAT